MGAVKYERLVEEDLDIGIGTVDRTMPGGGTAVGHRVGPQSFVSLGFAATAPGSQNLTGGASAATITLDTEVFDVASWFASNTFTPDVAGKYHFDGFLHLAAFSGTLTVGIYKNSTAIVEVDVVRTAAAAKVSLSALIDLDGDTDTVTLKAAHNDGVNTRAVTAARLSGFITGRDPSS